MQIRQISIFLENKPGQLSRICRDLADAGIDIAALSLADTSDFGIVRQSPVCESMVKSTASIFVAPFAH